MARKDPPAYKRPFKAVPLRVVRNRPATPPRFWQPEQPSWGQSFLQVRVGLLIIALLTLSIIFYLYDQRNRPPPEVGQVSGQFTRCGFGRGSRCVIDGDTFKVGQRRYRIVGIDTAEVEGRCPAEIAQAEASTVALREWLNRGPFELSVDPGVPLDRYGRTLATVSRAEANGDRDYLDDFMIREGGARPYAGGSRGGWC